MATTRRAFLTGTAALTGATAFAAARPSGAAADGRASDPDLVCLLSDPHVAGSPGAPDYMYERFAACVARVLALRPRPAHVILFGDLAHLTGQTADYARVKPLLADLEQAGIAVTVGMGNHDRRDHFAEVFPERAARTLVPGRCVSLVETPHVDFLMLDSLEGDGRRGGLDDAQRRWLDRFLDSRLKPTFVCAHHSPWELGLAQRLYASPCVAGYIHGHDHRWQKCFVIRDFDTSRLVRTMCLPSTGYWGDIGFVTMRCGRDRAVAELHQDDFFFPFPVPAEKRPPTWDAWREENRGATVTFFYHAHDVGRADNADFTRLNIARHTVAVGASRPFTALHLSDTHLALVDEEHGAPAPKNAVGRSRLFPRAADALKTSLAYARARDLPVFHTGDLIDYLGARNLSVAAKWGRHAPAGIVCAGNHEFCPWVGHGGPEDEAFKDRSRPRVQAAYPDDLAFCAKTLNGVNFVAIDNSFYQVAETVAARFEREVAKGLPIVLLCHVPFHTPGLCVAAARGRPMAAGYMCGAPDDLVDKFTDPVRREQQRPDAVTRRFTARLRREPLLKAILCGHLHWANVSEFAPGVTQYCVAANYDYAVNELTFT